MRTLILAGGFGTRLAEESETRPKPMVEVGGRPILWHIMNCYARYGFKEFVVALGYKGDVIKSYFLNYHHLHSSFTINLRTNHLDVHRAETEDWIVHLQDTGLHTQSGGRIKRAVPVLGGGTFMMTYGDGVADLDITQLVAFHRTSGRLATVTAVRPPARFGGLGFAGDRVATFSEKPRTGEGWINGGFFVLEPGVVDYIDGDMTVFERQPLERLAADGQLVAYRHEGFWHCMDTRRDVRFLNELCEGGLPPWQARRP